MRSRSCPSPPDLVRRISPPGPGQMLRPKEQERSPGYGFTWRRGWCYISVRACSPIGCKGHTRVSPPGGAMPALVSGSLASGKLLATGDVVRIRIGTSLGRLQVAWVAQLGRWSSCDSALRPPPGWRREPRHNGGTVEDPHPSSLSLGRASRCSCRRPRVKRRLRKAGREVREHITLGTRTARSKWPHRALGRRAEGDRHGAARVRSFEARKTKCACHVVMATTVPLFGSAEPPVPPAPSAWVCGSASTCWPRCRTGRWC